MSHTTLTRTDTAAPAASRRAGNLALWGLQVVAAALFVMAAQPKVTADPTAVTGFADLGIGVTGMFVIGVLELAGAVALLVPRLAGLAALALVALMTGAVIITVLNVDPGLAAMPGAVLVLVAVIAWGRRRSTAELVTAVRRAR